MILVVKTKKTNVAHSKLNVDLAAMKVWDAELHIDKAKIYETRGHYFLKTKQASKALESFQLVKSIFD